jgi:hypothetical protein
MARRSSLKRERREPNTVQLRATMPSGRTPSTDSAREPAAASFDTDDEAAGRPAQAAAIEQALAHEGRSHVQAPGKAKSVVAPIWTLAALLAVAVAVWFLLS